MLYLERRFGQMIVLKKWMIWVASLLTESPMEDPVDELPVGP
jgi:hypothetical protein